MCEEAEGLFSLIGEIGLYQGLACFLLTLISVFGIEAVAIIFVAAGMDHWCYVEELKDFSHDQQKYIAIPKDSSGNYDSCYTFNITFSDYTEDNYTSWNRSQHITNNTKPCSSYVYDQSIFVSTIISRYDLVCGKEWYNQLTSSLFAVGILVGSIVGGFVSDKYGRKNIMLIFLFIKIVANFMCTFADYYGVFAVGRFFAGCGSTGAYLIAFVLVMELVGPRYRTAFGVGFQLAYTVGFMALVGVAYAIRNDRMLQLTLNVPGVGLLLYAFFIFESPRWLLVKCKLDKAEAILGKICKINKTTLPPDVRSRLEIICKEVQHFEDFNKGDGNFFSLFKTPNLRKWTLVIFLQWFTASLMYYALTLNTEQLSGDIFINTLLSAVVEIPANIACIFLLNWSVTGRRLTCALSYLIAGVASLLCIATILIDNGTASTALSMVGKAFVTVAFSGVYVYTSEIFPTEVRNVGMGAASVMARIAGVLAPFVGGPLANVWRPLPMLVFGVFSTLTGLASFILPETLDHKLFDMVVEAEYFGRHPPRDTDTVDVVPYGSKEPKQVEGFNNYGACVNDADVSVRHPPRDTDSVDVVPYGSKEPNQVEGFNNYGACVNDADVSVRL